MALATSEMRRIVDGKFWDILPIGIEKRRPGGHYDIQPGLLPLVKNF